MEGIQKIRLAISSCLLGAKTRYDGGTNEDMFLKDILGKYVEYVSFCPEVEAGLTIPREPMRLIKTPEGIRIKTGTSGKDYTEKMSLYSQKKLNELKRFEICGVILKSRSPSCGCGTTKIYNISGNVIGKGYGIFAERLIANLPTLPVEDDGRLKDSKLRKCFFLRVIILHRWKRLAKSGLSKKGLVDFHTKTKLLLLSHNAKEYRRLGRLISNLSDKQYKKIAEDYIQNLMKALSKPSTPAMQANVLYHIIGYFKEFLKTDDKKELIQYIEDFRKGHIGISIPLTLIRHYIRKLDIEYLKKQFFLELLPYELRLWDY